MSCTYVEYTLKNKKILRGLQDSNNKGFVYEEIGLGFSNALTPIPVGARKKRLRVDFKNSMYNKDSEVVSFDNEKYKQIQKDTKGYKGYITQCNGIESFAVYINKRLKSVKIYKQPKGNKTYIYKSADTKWQFTEFVKEYKNIVRVFLGENAYSWKSTLGIGNTILIQQTKQKYVLIEENITSFVTKDQIKKFVSPVKNNDVPYPFAIGSKHVYFFPSNKKVQLSLIKDPQFFSKMTDFMYDRVPNPIEKTSFKRKLIFPRKV